MLILDTRNYAPGSSFSPEIVSGQSIEQWADSRGARIEWRNRPMFFFQKHSCDNAGHCIMEALYPAYVNMLTFVKPLCDAIGCDPFDSDIIMMENRVGNDCGCRGLVGCHSPEDWAKCEKNSGWFNRLLTDNTPMYVNELKSSLDTSVVECWSHAHAGAGAFSPFEAMTNHWKHAGINMRSLKDMAYKRTGAVVETALQRLARVGNDRVLRVLCQSKKGKRMLLGLDVWCNSLVGTQIVVDGQNYSLEVKVIGWEQTSSFKEQLDYLGWTDIYISTVGSGYVNGLFLRDDSAIIAGLFCNIPGTMTTESCSTGEYELIHTSAPHHYGFIHWAETPAEIVQSTVAYADQILVPDRAMFRLRQATRWVVDKVRGSGRLAIASAAKRNQTVPFYVRPAPFVSPTPSSTKPAVVEPTSASTTAGSTVLPQRGRGVLLGAVNNGGPGLQSVNTCQDAVEHSRGMIASVSAFPEVEYVILSKPCTTPRSVSPNITFMEPKLPTTVDHPDPSWWSSAGWFLGFRFLYFLEFVEAHPEYEYVVMADIFDVTMHTDPIKMMRALPEVDLFIQSEWRISAHSKYMQQRLPVCLSPEAVGPLQNIPILNCGVWGGKRNTVLTVLQSMRDTYANVITDWHLNKPAAQQCIGYGVDMSAFALIVHRLMESKGAVVKLNEPLTPVYRNCRFEYRVAGSRGQPIDVSDNAAKACTDPHPKMIPFPPSTPMEEADGWVVNFCSTTPNPPAVVSCPKLPFAFVHKDAITYQ
jgi:hypothetical protein